MPVIDVFGGVSGRDLAGVLDDIKPLIADAEKALPHGSSIILRGQAQTMRASFIGLGVGLVMAIALIYLLLVVNFQSWLDPFIILTALAGALAGTAWGLHLTATTLSVPAMMGAIMCLGVATANSVLVVTFARQNLAEGRDPIRAAWEAGSGTPAPVLMTAAGDDHRHGADGARARRRRRTKRAARARRHRRAAHGHRGHTLFRAGGLQPPAPPPIRSRACLRGAGPNLYPLTLEPSISDENFGNRSRSCHHCHRAQN
jgi:hypothetical protein